MNAQEMQKDAAYRSFLRENSDIVNSLKSIKFPESALEYTFKQGYSAREFEIKEMQSIQDKIFEALNLK